MKTADEMIEALVEDMASWDYDSLLGWAQDAREEMLRHVDEETVQEEYEDLAEE